MDQPFIGNVKNPGRVSRIVILLVIIRSILLIPQQIVILVWSLLAGIALPIMWIIAIFTAKYPDSWFNFVMGYEQKLLQIGLYGLGITNKYPPFSLGTGEFTGLQKSQQV